ncbi:MAG: amidohydrolase family protein [Phycisphaerae bacterium]|nr:amidohydrolase family protein [Phycisphaerae bacterium]
MTIVIEGSTIVAIEPTKDGDLRDRDVLVDARGGFVIPGFLESLVPADGATTPSYGQLAARTSGGVTTVVSTWDAREVAWLGRIGETSSFPIPDPQSRQPAPVEASVADRLRERAAERPAPTRESRAKALRDVTAGRAERFGLADRGTIAVGKRADLLVLTADPLDDLDATRNPTQMVLGGKTLRIAALATARSMNERTESFLKDLPKANAYGSRFAIESGGLRLGRLDVNAFGRAGFEWWGPPINRWTAWSFARSFEVGKADHWTTVQTVFATVDMTKPALGVELRFDGTALDVTTTTYAGDPIPPAKTERLPIVADFAIIDPISAVGMAGRDLARLDVGESKTFTVAEVDLSPASARLGVREITVERIDPSRSPMPIPDGARAFRLRAAMTGPVGADTTVEIGWVAGFPDRVEAKNPGQALPPVALLRGVRAALLAPDGITEYLPDPDVAFARPPAGSSGATDAKDVPAPRREPNSPPQDSDFPQPAGPSRESLDPQIPLETTRPYAVRSRSAPLRQGVVG